GSRFVKVVPAMREPSIDDRQNRLAELFADYNAVGITGVWDRDASAGEVDLYQKLKARSRLSVRVAVSHDVAYIGSLDQIQANIRLVARHPLFRAKDDMLRIIGIKTFLDGGMLTGSAYMREPWGVSKIYGITDPEYRGVLFIPKEKLRGMVKAAAESGLQFTAHSVGDGAVHMLLDVYDELDRELPLHKTRPCISHSNFMLRAVGREGARSGGG